MYVFRSIITGFFVCTGSREELCLEARPPTRFPLRFRWPFFFEELFDVLSGVLDSTVLETGFVGVAAFVEPEEFFFETGLGNETVVDFPVVVADNFLLLGVDIDGVTGDDEGVGVTAAADDFGFALVLLGEEGPAVDDDDDDLG